MSLILDALNRAQRERGDDNRAGPPIEPVATAPSRRIAVLSVALALACALVGWLLWERTWDAQTPPSTASASRAIESKQAESKAQPSAQAKPGLKAEPVVSTVSPRLTPAPTELITDEELVAVDPAVAALYIADGTEPTPSLQTDVGEAFAPPPKAETRPVERTETAVDINEVLAQVRDELGEPELTEHPAPLLAQLSQQQKNAIPTLMYLRHDYSASGRSTVVLNKQTCGVDDTVNGVRVEEILAESVVLSYRDTMFRLRALNSWVNL